MSGTIEFREFAGAAIGALAIAFTSPEVSQSAPAALPSEVLA